MTLTTKLNAHFNAKTRAKGLDYFRSGAVSIGQGDPYSVTALVEGTDTYHVTLELDGTDLRAWCTCPYVDQYDEPCKHLWASLLAAERRGHLREAEQRQRLRLLLDPDLADEFADALEDDDFDDAPPPPPRPTPPRRASRRPSWKSQLEQVRERMQRDVLPFPGRWPENRRVLYVLDLAGSQQRQRVQLALMVQDLKKDGTWGKPKAEPMSRHQLGRLPDPADRHLLALLFGAEHEVYSYAYGGGYSYTPSRFALSTEQVSEFLPAIGATGRLRLRAGPQPDELGDLHWDDGPAWELCLEVAPAGKQYQLAGTLRRGEERLPLTTPVLLVPGLVVWDGRAARFDDRGAFAWVATLRQHAALAVQADKKDELLQELLQLPNVPALRVPDELQFTEVAGTPKPRLKIRAPKESWRGGQLEAELSFAYDGQLIDFEDPARGAFDPESRRFYLRDRAAENAAFETLVRLGFRRHAWYNQKPRLELTPRHLARVVHTLVEAGWHVEAEGKLYRQPGEFKIEVRSGIDWFDLHGSVDFGDQTVSLPQLLKALRKGDKTIPLGDGTLGMLPDDWLKKYGLLGGLGTEEGDAVRYTRAQVGLLDALLAAQPDVRLDEVFQHARDELRAFDGIEPAEPPPGFVGELRPYQKEGLGWLHFLQRFGFGGCLADDMGLGKTVQVLTLLESRRAERAKKKRPPSLVVVPKSLVFNWKQEAARFAPELRVLDHTGLGRAKTTEPLNDYDVILTTYGTLRRDVLLFKDFTFDYVILDESQAIKNASSESAKAARLLKGAHRLAMSGTPIENHLGELWSLFEFLNPGLLGQASLFRLTGGAARNPDPETRLLLARGLRPFILRRTKEQVAKDLPAKTEQTLFCDLEPAQRKLYDELRDHYRQSLLTKIAEVGLKRAKIQVLEALLRLRQAACHPGLIDKARANEGSAKLDLLLEHIGAVVAEGHKCLVFSQFTSLLAIARDRLDKADTPYEYLDGRTRDRQARVERFQNDPDCKLFLISLKAGGVGLNLTAAEYVFLLDPWWNPAVEAQAIDRTHRIGQERPVFAYRLIARDTVEEKVLELQRTKRDLADAVINADNSLITNLQREDLELLLS